MLFTTENTLAREQTRYWVLDIVTLTILLGLFYAVWIGSYPLFTPDEGRYSEVAREMVVTHDYITPRLNGVAFLDKPILYYWLQASAINLFGLKEWALRLWPAIAGILGALVSYLTGRILFNRRTGLLAATILALSPLYYGASHYANLDLEVASFVSDALLCFIAAMQTPLDRLKTILLYSAYFFAGLAALTKGLIGIAFPAMIIGAWICILNRWRTLLKMHLFPGLSLFLLITVPWYIQVQKANPEFLHFFFYTQQVSRFLTTQVFNSRVAFWFYLPVVLAGFFPWSIFLMQAIGHKFKNCWHHRQKNATDVFLLVWLTIIFVFFSIPHSKTVGYILPIFPALAMVVASYLDSIWQKPQIAAVVAARYGFIGIGMLLGAVTVIASYQTQLFDISTPFMPYLQHMSLILLVAALFVLFLPTQQTLRAMFTLLLATTGLLLLIFINSAKAINEKTVKPLFTEVMPFILPTDEIVSYYKYYQDLPLYTQKRITIVADWHATDIPDYDNWVREMWYGMVFQDTTAWLIGEDTFWERWNSSKHLYVVTNTDYYAALQKKTKVYKISQHNDTVLLSNQPFM